MTTAAIAATIQGPRLGPWRVLAAATIPVSVDRTISDTGSASARKTAVVSTSAVALWRTGATQWMATAAIIQPRKARSVAPVTFT